MQKENDTLLVAKLREGNKFAFEALYEKYSARLYNTIVLLVYDKSLAKDITQSSFMTIWEKRSNLDTEKSFPAYLCTIARNMVYKETAIYGGTPSFISLNIISEIKILLCH